MVDFNPTGEKLPHDPLILKARMTNPNARQDAQQQFRVKAEERLKGGNPPATRGATTGPDSLALLHSLASSPASAGDALKLLHELQVHQVELDLQHEQAEEDRQPLVEALQSYANLFDAAPFGYLTLDPDGKVVAANQLAAAWLGVERVQWTGRLLADLVHSDDRLAINELLRSVRDGGGRQKRLLRSKTQSDAVQAVVSVASTAIAAIAANAASAASSTPGVPMLLAFMPAD